MKNRFMRILSLILILASLVSVFAVFASAETSEDGAVEGGEEDAFQLLYNRTYDEGWDIENGAKWQDLGSYATIESETTPAYTNNYFWRFEVGSSSNSYLQLEFDNNDKIGSVFEFDIKSDDYCNINGLMHFGTVGGSSAARKNWNIISVKDNMLYFFDQGTGALDKDGSLDDSTEKLYSEPAFKLTDEWMHIAFVFDYTYDHDPEDGEPETTFFRMHIYYGVAEEYRKTGELTHYATHIYSGKPNAKGLFLFRINTTNEPEDNWGTSVCFDNLQCYNGSNEYGKVTPDMGYGSKVKENYPVTEEIQGAGGIGEMTLAQYFAACYALKLDIDHAYNAGKRVPVLENEKGEAYGAPFMDRDGNVWVAFKPIVEYCGYSIYEHEDGVYIDISTGDSSSFISTESTSATVGGERVELNTPPAYATDADGNEFLVVNIKDIHTILPEYNAEYDDMGLVVITSSPKPIVDRDNNMAGLLTLMKQFVFDFAEPDTIYEDVKENTNGFTHPYLHTNQEYLDYLHDVWSSEEGDENYNAELKDMLDDQVWYGEHYYEMYAYPDANGEHNEYVGLRSDEDLLDYLINDYYGVDRESSARSAYLSSYSLEAPYYSADLGGINGGYDPNGGRLNESSARMNYLQYMAYAYQITRDTKYLGAMYDFALRMGEWPHWGPGHFLNVADATAPFAVFYDLTYNAYVNLYSGKDNNGDGFVSQYEKTVQLDGEGNPVLGADGEPVYVDAVDGEGNPIPSGDILGQKKYDVKTLAEILYTHGVYEGVISSKGIYTEFTSTVVGVGGSIYYNRVNNWNAVCTAGMAIGALAIIGEEAYREDASWLISSNMKTLMQYGMDVYAPEGAYNEGTGYWNYGTNNFFELCSALLSSTGTTYNLMNCWGIETTCYYACHTESSDYRTFNYHDGGMGQQATEFFYFVGQYFSDNTLQYIRQSQLKGGKSYNIFDILYYPTEELEETSIELDYYSKSIDLFASRSSWEPGSMYVGIIGGNNDVSHGQIDAGSFVYHNCGTVWFIDLGTEDYNCDGFWGNETRYRYYVMKPEGNNTISLSSDHVNVPYGQKLQSVAYALENYSDEHGAYVIYDMTDTLGGLASNWRRGVLVTNDRQTTVIQDEIAFPDGVQTVHWFGHYSQSYVDKVELAPNGRTAYMTSTRSGEEKMIRVSIISDNPNYKFELMDCYTFVQVGDKGTFAPEYAQTHGTGVPEKNRSSYRKLAISAISTMTFNVAVVIEEIDPDTRYNTADQIPVGYKSFVNMNQWEVTEDNRFNQIEDDVDQVKLRPARRLATISADIDRIAVLMEKGRVYTSSDIEKFYEYLTEIQYIQRGYDYSDMSAYLDDLEQFEAYKAEYDAYQSGSNTGILKSRSIVRSLMGLG